ncbi:MAG: DEAD/DEAH box helicase [Desulfobulbaceae bacterium]|nr:DEAD/DEAH box helicase [Desulfobulbaceae bacterium]
MTEDSSSSFDLLHEKVRKWIWREGWEELHYIQEEAIRFVLCGRGDLIISAATAGGKTEAVFLPLCSQLVDKSSTGIDVLCVSPLKALINDQFRRIEQMCEGLKIAVHKWHGDVAQNRKHKVLKKPSGILIITPESLEALFVIRGHQIGRLFGSLSHVVIDELHSFIGSVRGRQLQSLLHRTEVATGRSIPRIGLSATLGDMGLAAEFMRPKGGPFVKQIQSDDDAQEIRLQIRGCVVSGDEAQLNGQNEDVGDGNLKDICAHIFKVLRGSDNLIFANRRRDVEICADILRRLSEDDRVPNEFLPHHGSLSKEIREEAEIRLKDKSRPTSIVCTNTLELGIDVGNVSSIAQLDSPPSVAALRQRLGRSGRRAGEAGIMRLYVREEKLTPKSSVIDRLRAQLFQSIAMVQLLLEKWYEPPQADALDFSTLVQQTLSVLAERGGGRPLPLWKLLCKGGSFDKITQATYGDLLRAIAAEDLISQASDGTLFLGDKGERIVNHYEFFSAFKTPEEYKLISGNKTLGSLPIEYPVTEGSYLIFAGRRWVVVAVDSQRKVIELTPTKAGKPPMFGGHGARVHKRIRSAMLDIYSGADQFSFLDAKSRKLLLEGRQNFHSMGLARRSVVQAGEDVLLFCWDGDQSIYTLLLQLMNEGFRVEKSNFVLSIENKSEEEVFNILEEILASGISDEKYLASRVRNKITEKYDHFLAEELLTIDYASKFLNSNGAKKLVESIVNHHSG